MQSGQGADEVFAGYSWYQAAARAAAGGSGADAYRAAFFDRPHAELAEMLEADAPARAGRQPGVRRGALRARPAPTTPVDRALRLDTEVMLVDDPVKRVDNMTMAWGLEARVPFLDHEFVELAAACPPELKLAQGGKGVLKEAARRVLPAEVIDRPKGYFPVPQLSSLEGEALELVRDVMAGPARGSAGCSAASTSTRCSPTPARTRRRSRAPSSGRWRCWSCGCSAGGCSQPPT